MNIKKIKDQYKKQQDWQRQTRDALIEEVKKVIGDKEWHFAPRRFNQDTSIDARRIAGLRIVDGQVQYCEAGGSPSWRVRYEDGKEVERVRTWRWTDFIYKHISWWIILYDHIIAVEKVATKHEHIAKCECTNDYEEPVAGEDQTSIGL